MTDTHLKQSTTFVTYEFITTEQCSDGECEQMYIHTSVYSI